MNNVDTPKAKVDNEVVFYLSNKTRVSVLNDETLYVNGHERSAISEMPTPSNAYSEAVDIMRTEYIKVLAKPYENIVFLSGAGTSITSGGKTMEGLWKEISTNVASFNDFLTELNYDSKPPYDLEKLLSYANRRLSVTSDGKTQTLMLENIKAIQNQIKVSCNLEFKKDISAHLKLLNKLTSRKLKYGRIKVFTLNYDTLFEQAANHGRYIVINGFSFGTPSYFNGEFFDYDVIKRSRHQVNDDENYVPKVFHLYKPHGSLNWTRNEDGSISAGDILKPQEEPLMIFPNSDKYESSYDQPFFEMMSKFQQYVRTKNTLLICAGFSFGDKHFKNVITEAVKNNPGLVVLVTMKDFVKNDNVKELVGLTESQNNIIFAGEYFEEFADNYPFASDYEHETI